MPRKDFQAAFIVAQLDPLRALPILRVPGTGREPDLNERQLHARRRVHEAMAALGGISQPGGLVRLARGRAAAERARVGDAPGLGWTAGAAGAGAGDPGRGARDAGGALRVRRGQAGVAGASGAAGCRSVWGRYTPVVATRLQEPGCRPVAMTAHPDQSGGLER